MNRATCRLYDLAFCALLYLAACGTDKHPKPPVDSLPPIDSGLVPIDTAPRPDSVVDSVPVEELPAPVDTVKHPVDTTAPPADTATPPVVTPPVDTAPPVITPPRDTTPPVVTPPPGTKLDAGWGPSGQFNETSSGPWTFAPNESSNQAQWVLDNIAEARARKMRVQLALPCGSHSGERDSKGAFIKLGNCLVVKNGQAVFSRPRFDSAMKAVATPAVRAAVAKAYQDGVVTALHIIDEPWVHGGDDGAGNIVGNTWGLTGTITRAVADQLCGVTTSFFPGVPVGMSDFKDWDPTHQLKVCDFSQPQYSYRFGDVRGWRDTMLARARKAGHQTVFSFNWLNGGVQDRDGTWDCKAQGGRKGNRSPNCQMTPAQILEVITALGDQTCGGLMSWRYDATRFSAPEYQAAIAQGIAIQKKRTYRPCKARA